jgi:protein TonB
MPAFLVHLVHHPLEDFLKERSMSRSKSTRLFLASMLLMSAGVVHGPAQSLAQQTNSSAEIKDHGGRKVKSFVKPDYPEVARKMQISGTVRLEATVTPDGKVRDTKVIGGSPLLVQEATNAVKKWRYEDSPKETVETVEVVFQ